MTDASVAMIAITTNNSMSVNARRACRVLVLRDTYYLLDGGEAKGCLAPAITLQRFHSALDGERPQLASTCLTAERILERVSHDIDLEQSNASPKPSSPA